MTPALMPKTPASSGVDKIQYALALYDRTEDDCTEAEDLSFSAGDKLQILEQDGDWWLCKLFGSMRSGLVPANYVSILNEGNDDGAPANFGRDSPPSLPMATAIYGRSKDECTDDDDLPFTAGSRLQVFYKMMVTGGCAGWRGPMVKQGLCLQLSQTRRGIITN